jgi:hypothetical protein
MVNSNSRPLSLSQVLNAAFPEGEGGTTLEEIPVQVIPQGNEPRWVVIGDSGMATPVFRSWRPFKVSTRLRWNAVIAASSLGALSRLPGVATSRTSIDLSYWRHRLTGFDDDWRPVLHIGNPSYTRKVTVFFVGADRRFKAVGKVPLLDDSTQAILNESDILRSLDGADYLPACIFEDPQRGVAAQSWLEGDPVSRELTPAHMDLLARFAIAGGTMRVSGQRAQIAAELDEGDFPFDREVLARALEFLDYDEPLPAFLEHRDFAPWNLKRLRDGRTGAIDWEWAVLRSLPCQDIFRYFYIQDALFHGPGDVWQRLNSDPGLLAHYRRFAISPDALPALAMHYQLRVLAMDWKGGNQRLAEYAFEQIKTVLDLRQARPVKV